MIVANLSSNRGRKVCCVILVFMGAVSLFAWHLVVNVNQQKWLITWLTAKQQNSSQLETKLTIFEKKFLTKSKSLRNGLYTDLKKSIGKMKNSTKVKEVQERIQPEPFPTKVLIISRGRSGSSFLGDLFNENKKMFYLFEPLAWSLEDRKGNAAKSFKILEDLYNCKFMENEYLNFLLKKGASFRKKSNKLITFPGQCSRISTNAKRCLENILKSSCLGASSVIAKVLTHRLPQGGLWGIRKILDANKELRIIHLIRDPRRVIASMKKAGWYKRKRFSSQVKAVCGSIWENIKHVQNESAYFKDRYKLLIFSDMMLNPFSTVVDLYDFLKMAPVPEYVFSWIIRNTMGYVGRGGTYKTSRNSTEVLNKKLDFTELEESVIDRYCGDVVKFISRFRKT